MAVQSGLKGISQGEGRGLGRRGVRRIGGRGKGGIREERGGGGEGPQLTETPRERTLSVALALISVKTKLLSSKPLISESSCNTSRISDRSAKTGGISSKLSALSSASA